MIRYGSIVLSLLALLCWAPAGYPQAEQIDEVAEAPEVQEPAPPAPPDRLKQIQDRAALEALVGTWTAHATDTSLTLEDDGSYVLDNEAGNFVVEGNNLILERGDERTVYTYELTPTGDLQLTGGQLSKPFVFSRQLNPTRTLADLFDISPEALTNRLRRIGFILGIVLVARLVIAALNWGSRKLIASRWGALRLVWRNQNRARTIHSLVLNTVKYFIYFTALGMVLQELGVNYTTYIASLSVVGLAIGFGSQGLVQDMVTGFFIIFENQFDVGDMVEISGQTGYVAEIGLRMTKIRNYLGQIVVIPNRNIAIVGNYSRGAQRAYVDVFIAEPAAATQAMPVTQQVAEEVMKQFDGVLLPPLRVNGPISLATGEHYVRLHLSLWPGQTWVVDAQIVPRLREAFARAGLTIPNDRVAVHYHAREKVVMSQWHERIHGMLREARGRLSRSER